MDKLIQKTIDDFELPRGLKWYTIAGQNVFPVYGCSGGISAGFAAYLYQKLPHGMVDMGLGYGKLSTDGEGRWCPVGFAATDDREAILKRLTEAVEVFNA